MASLGNIGVNMANFRSMKVAPMAVYRGDGDSSVIGYNVAGRISGVVSIGGVATAGVVVRLYYHDSGNLIDQAISGSGGTYAFSGLNTSEPGAYYVTFVDPKTSTPYNYTVTRDHLTAG